MEKFVNKILVELDKIAPEKLVDVSTKQGIDQKWMAPRSY